MTRTKAKNDEQILQAIGQLLGRDGVAAFTFEKLSNEVGLSQATLVQRFGSKRGLLLKLTRQSSDAVVLSFRTTTKQVDDPIEAILHGFGAFVAGAANVRSMGSGLSFLQLATQDQEIHKIVTSRMKELENEIIALLEKAIQVGRIKIDTDVATLARLIFVTYNGTGMAWAMLGNTNLQDELERNLRTVIEPYIANPA